MAIGFQRRLAARFGVAPDRVRLDHAGLNHLSWIRRVLVDGVDRLPELLESDHIDELVAELDMPAELLRTLGAIPSYYLHYFYCTDRAVHAQPTGPQRARRCSRSSGRCSRCTPTRRSTTSRSCSSSAAAPTTARRRRRSSRRC